VSAHKGKPDTAGLPVDRRLGHRLAVPEVDFLRLTGTGSEQVLSVPCGTLAVMTSRYDDPGRVWLDVPFAEKTKPRPSARGGTPLSGAGTHLHQR
jgi:hypothetical protein